MKVEFEYMRPNMLGWGCPDCCSNAIFIEGAIMHEQAIIDNGGVCPRVEEPTND